MGLSAAVLIWVVALSHFTFENQVSELPVVSGSFLTVEAGGNPIFAPEDVIPNKVDVDSEETPALHMIPNLLTQISGSERVLADVNLDSALSTSLHVSNGNFIRASLNIPQPREVAFTWHTNVSLDTVENTNSAGGGTSSIINLGENGDVPLRSGIAGSGDGQISTNFGTADMAGFHERPAEIHDGHHTRKSGCDGENGHDPLCDGIFERVELSNGSKDYSYILVAALIVLLAGVGGGVVGYVTLPKS